MATYSETTTTVMRREPGPFDSCLSTHATPGEMGIPETTEYVNPGPPNPNFVNAAAQASADIQAGAAAKNAAASFETAAPAAKNEPPPAIEPAAPAARPATSITPPAAADHRQVWFGADHATQEIAVTHKRMSDGEILGHFQHAAMIFKVDGRTYKLNAYASTMNMADQNHVMETRTALVDVPVSKANVRKIKFSPQQRAVLMPDPKDSVLAMRARKIVVDKITGSAGRAVRVVERSMNNGGNAVPLRVAIEDCVGPTNAVLSVNVPGMDTEAGNVYTKTGVLDMSQSDTTQNRTTNAVVYVGSDKNRKHVLYGGAAARDETSMLACLYGSVDNPRKDFGLAREGDYAFIDCTSPIIFFVVSAYFLPDNKYGDVRGEFSSFAELSEALGKSGYTSYYKVLDTGAYNRLAALLTGDFGRGEHAKFVFSHAPGVNDPTPYLVVPRVVAEWLYDKYMEKVAPHLVIIGNDALNLETEFLGNTSPQEGTVTMTLAVKSAVPYCEISIHQSVEIS